MKLSTLSLSLVLAFAASASAAPFWAFGGTQNDLFTSSNGFKGSGTNVIEIIDPINQQVTPIILGRDNNTQKNVYFVQGTQTLQVTLVPYAANGGSYTVIAFGSPGGGQTAAEFIKGNNATIEVSNNNNKLAPLTLTGVAGVLSSTGTLRESTITLYHNTAYTKSLNNSFNTMGACVNKVVVDLRTAGYVDGNTGQ